MKEFDMICDICSIIAQSPPITPRLMFYKDKGNEEKLLDIFDLCEDCDKLLNDWRYINEQQC
jgi:hypothetical protein